jgi:hypothetical protein
MDDIELCPGLTEDPVMAAPFALFEYLKWTLKPNQISGQVREELRTFLHPGLFDQDMIDKNMIANSGRGRYGVMHPREQCTSRLTRRDSLTQHIIPKWTVEVALWQHPDKPVDAHVKKGLVQ